ncbi:hypothetical protein [Caproiciproducens sp.]
MIENNDRSRVRRSDGTVREQIQPSINRGTIEGREANPAANSGPSQPYPAEAIKALQEENKGLRMENELMRLFLSL